MTLLAVGSSWALAVVALVIAVRAHRRSLEALDSPKTTVENPFDDGPLQEAIAYLDAAVEGQDGRIKELVQAIAEGIERVDRSERRVRAVVTRAQRRLDDAGLEDEGLQAEAAALSDYDVPVGSGQRLSPLPTPLEADRFAAFPGSFAGFGG